MSELDLELYDNPEQIKFTTPLPLQQFLDGVPKSARILDIGCGYGRILKYFYELGYENLTGIDVSSRLINRARNYLPCANYFIEDILDWKISSNYDLVLICGVLEYFVEPINRTKLVSQIDCLLDNNGKVYLEAFTLDQKYLKSYLVSFLKGETWGTIQLNEKIKVFHTSPKEIDGLFAKSFCKEMFLADKFVTWSNKSVNGYISLYRKGS
ncbi:class I SAM-dependent methyltransferase [Microcoleus sp. CZ3-B4]|uniref:class I SAM-dependent methyltransferase n=1 Tax=Microcoleus sp. CZ3-B4 TaxID=2818733 RepID=UPI002FD2F64A